MSLQKIMKNYPEYFVETMTATRTLILNPKEFEALFIINHNPEGSNKRNVENLILSFWKNFIIDCFGIKLDTCYSFEFFLSYLFTEFENTDETELEEYEISRLCSLEEILIFCTGSNNVPVFGFDHPIYIEFLHEDSSVFPKANTCGLHLHLPVTHDNYDTFKNQMSYGIRNGLVFALS